MPSNRNLPVTPEFKESLRVHAFVQRTSMSALVRQAIDDVAEQGTLLVKQPDVVLTAEIKYLAPESYDKAMEVAHEAGVSFAEAIRFRLEQIVRGV